MPDPHSFRNSKFGFDFAQSCLDKEKCRRNSNVETKLNDPSAQAQDKLREKPFSDPPHSLGMTGFDPLLCVLGVPSTSPGTDLLRQPELFSYFLQRVSTHSIDHSTPIGPKSNIPLFNSSIERTQPRYNGEGGRGLVAG